MSTAVKQRDVQVSHAFRRKQQPVPTPRVRAAGKFLRLGADKFFVKGFSYGPFAPNDDGEPLPNRAQVRRDFQHIRELGANTIRLYFPPPIWLLDEALECGLFVFIDVPWEKHRCFFEDWEAMQRARERVRDTAARLGSHPAVFAISVVNEFPVDVVRFQGRQRVQRFVGELLNIAKQEAPECLVTFVNFPTTEFLEVSGCDFTCFNVYLHDSGQFSSYLDRLQHIAGNKPLVLGEYGIDSQREGDVEQAEMLSGHLSQVFSHGVCGSVIFAYTDDWFTGGHQIDDWFFGVTRADRSEKPAAQALRRLWAKWPKPTEADSGLPRVSVVVCSYNGAKTLDSCFESLMQLDYHDYEVILVDDGSTDGTAEIAAQYPMVQYYYQPNQGLSVARNVGAELADGEIVVYTDDDCDADEHWLLYLVQAMEDQQVEAIGGPNITPDSDSWVAKCVAASPGNPSHVMLDDTHAEHIPGCNMAFRRSTLLGLGGFDPQFRVAGDDVDVCWRMLDAGLSIGYAPGAMVWHHRRASVKAYRKQQQGYGRSEALVHFKHPQRCGSFGRSNWGGIIYGDGAVGLPLMPDRIYHGQFGGGLFQTIYRHNNYGLWCVMMSLEWHLGSLFMLVLSLFYWPLLLVGLLMWCGTLALAVDSAIKAPLPRKSPFWCRPLVGYLYLMQPIWRGWTRLTHLLRNKRIPDIANVSIQGEAKRISANVHDFYWDEYSGMGREQLLERLVDNARRSNWAGDFDNAWASWDLKLIGDPWHNITIVAATEELGWPRRFTRLRCKLIPTWLQIMLVVVIGVWSAVALLSGYIITTAVAGSMVGAYLLFQIQCSRHRCLDAAGRLIAWSSVEVGLGADAKGEQQAALIENATLEENKTGNDCELLASCPADFASAADRRPPYEETHGRRSR